MIIVALTMDILGSVTAVPRNQSLNRAVASYLNDEWDVRAKDASVYHSDEEWQTSSVYNLSPSQIRDVDQGWTVNIKVDSWSFLHGCGWDTHEAVEPDQWNRWTVRPD